MKELFTFLWTSAPELMSVLGIIGILVYIAVKLTLFFAEFKHMGTRIGNLEKDVADIRRTVDKIMEYFLTGKADALRK